MRLENFDSTGVNPIGEGAEKKVFINPEDQKKVISERKEGIEEETGLEKDTHRQLKARYYLTQIVQLLLPKNIPHVYNIGESKQGIQIADVERIEHMESHARLQEINKLRGDTDLIKKDIEKELGEEGYELIDKLHEFGLGSSIDETFGNYIKDEKGNVRYIETFNPWEKDVVDNKNIRLLFDEEELRGAIESNSDEKVRNQCIKHLERVLTLFEEEKQELKNQPEPEKIENNEKTKELELRMELFEASFSLEDLRSIIELSDQDAEGHPLWWPAKMALGEITKKRNEVWADENISSDKKSQLEAKYKMLSKAVGIRNRGQIDHTR